VICLGRFEASYVRLVSRVLRECIYYFRESDRGRQGVELTERRASGLRPAAPPTAAACLAPLLTRVSLPGHPKP
jgi:hypothetical protein